MKTRFEIPILFTLISISLFPLFALFHDGLPLTHDGKDHVARIANFYQSLQEGNVVPRWAGNLNWGYGHPILMFLYPLPSYMASLFHFFGFSFVDSVKMVFGLAFIASILAMFFWIRSQYGVASGLIASLIYGFSPYRFVDLYVRGAIGEHVAFVFPPLLCMSIDRIRKSLESDEIPYRWVITFGVLLCMLILSHNALSMMFLPLILLYALFVQSTSDGLRIRFFIRIALGLFLGFAMSAFFWVPAFIEGKYTLRNIVTGDDVFHRFVPIQQFFISPWNYGGSDVLSKDIGIIVWILLIVSSSVIFVSKTKKIRLFMASSLALFAASLLLMTRWSEIIWKSISIMQKFQFPWRLLSVSVFTASIVCGIGIGYLIDRYITRPHLRYGLIFIGILIIFSMFTMWIPKDYFTFDSQYYSGIYDGTTDTGESSPIWSVRFMEHRYRLPIEIVNGNADIQQNYRSSTHHAYTVNASTPVRIVENTLYFPGWHVYVDGVDTPLQYQDPVYRGLMTFSVPQGNHTVSVLFNQTKIRRISDMISIAAWTVFVCVLAYATVWKRKNIR